MSERDELLDFAKRLLIERVRRGDHENRAPHVLRQWCVTEAIQLARDLDMNLEIERLNAEANAKNEHNIEVTTNVLRASADWTSEATLKTLSPLIGDVTIEDVLEQMYFRHLVEHRVSTDQNLVRLREYAKMDTPHEWRLVPR